MFTFNKQQLYISVEFSNVLNGKIKPPFCPFVDSSLVFPVSASTIFHFIHVPTAQTAWIVCRLCGTAVMVHKWVSFLAGSRPCPWPNNSYTHWSSSTPNLLSTATLYNVREVGATWLSSVLSQ